ncbi:chorismate mutase [Fluviispira multicolorata]|uniref:chorismate mutase n=1 Tax=Fluviispira multicolorata TaxID=2654512 RepID=A0A833N3I8_9BACT|nr:chorismate mutase [Fluviispira multicolorata]KAB8028563.1 hypothetical protein GCL57_12630 [Fluviispira multicolorata]
MKKQIRFILTSVSILLSMFCGLENSYSLEENVKIEECSDLNCVRSHIDEINKGIVLLLAKRMQYVVQAGEIKLKNNIVTAYDKKRAELVVNNAEEFAKEKGLPSGFTKEIFQVIVDKSRDFEQIKMDKKSNLDKIKTKK